MAAARSSERVPLLPARAAPLALAGADYDFTSPYIYHNNGDGTFRLAATPSTLMYGWGAVLWGDYDNDGDADLLYLPGNSAPRLYRNDGNGPNSRSLRS